MAASKNDIREWLDRAKTNGATHMLVVCDTFDHEDYPVEVLPGDDVRARYDHYNGRDMQRVMEVYNLAMDLELQLAEFRAFNF